jgi:transcriptional regulator with XRE-family HTH domain
MYPNLKIEIFKRGIHQNNIARELGLNEAVLSKIIRGYREPTVIQKQMLAQYFQLDESWLFEKYDGNFAARVSRSPALRERKDSES